MPREQITCNSVCYCVVLACFALHWLQPLYCRGEYKIFRCDLSAKLISFYNVKTDIFIIAAVHFVLCICFVVMRSHRLAKLNKMLHPSYSATTKLCHSDSINFEAAPWCCALYSKRRICTGAANRGLRAITWMTNCAAVYNVFLYLELF